MKAILVVLVATQAAGCVAGAGFGYSARLRPASISASVPVEPSSPSLPSPEPSPSSPEPSDGGEPGLPYGPGEDRHWFSSDDYLVASNSERTERVQEMRVAKMTERPTDISKGDARFLIANGNDLWTRNYHRSRVAEPADLVVGAPAFCHSITIHRSGAKAPQDKQDSRNHEWYFGPVTDASDVYKGRVFIGRHSCPIGAVRVPIR